MAAPIILPPYVVRRDFLPPEMAMGLLAFAQDNEARFTPSRVGYGNPEIELRQRRSLMLRDIGPFRDALRERLAAQQAELAAALGMTPFRRSRFEFQLVAHGDGTFLGRHADIQRPGDEPSPSRRVLTGVYYIHAEPKAFTGGALRLHELLPRGGEGAFVDVVPERNACVFFPAWMPHEVMPVSCPSQRFADARFSVNCWFHQAV